MLWGTIGSLALNVCLIVLFSHSLGMLGPAIAFLVAEIALELFYASRMSRTLGLGFANLADWHSIFRVAISCVVALPILIGFDMLPGPEIIGASVAAMMYFALVFLIAYRLGVADIGRVAGFVWSLFQTRSTR